MNKKIKNQPIHIRKVGFFMKKIFLIVAIIVIYMIFKSEEVTFIPSESIRFRIIPHSNNVEDVFIKEKVLENIKSEITGYETSSISEARTILSSNIKNIELKIRETLEKYDYDKDYDIKFGFNYFPEKRYEGQTYDEGYYESLVIELGDAKGDNFWCVLFPPLCLMEVEETEKEEIEYSFFFFELFDKIFE